ncbi:MAG: hypothetical protein M3540_07660 [Actinomycetota bacterium]|nr:hypothetical protein [Actinomycetota bacterium]
MLALSGVAGLLLAALAILLLRNGDGTKTFTGVAADDPGPVHVHGLGINPSDGSLFIATHTGLYKVAPDSRRATRVADRLQDTMGFTIVGPNRFLGSGHPDFRDLRDQKLPPLLGLIESTDAGESWKSISLLGKADFHVLRSIGQRVYGYDATNDRLLTSSDAGRTWRELVTPGPIIDLVADPANPRRLIVASASNQGEGLYLSGDAGRSWNRIEGPAGLLAWSTSRSLHLVTGGGLVFVSRDGARNFQHVGDTGGAPAAFLAETPQELYVALHDGTIKASRDGGRTWNVRSTP